MTNQKLAEKLDEFMNRLPQPERVITPEERATLERLGMPIPTPKSSVDEKLDDLNSKILLIQGQLNWSEKLLGVIEKNQDTFKKEKNWFLGAVLCAVILLGLLPFLSIDGCKQNPTPPDNTINVKTWGDKIYAEAVKKKIAPIGTGNAGSWPICLTPSLTPSVRKS